MRRKINLSRLGFDFESVDIEVSDCETKMQAMQEIFSWKSQIIELAKEETSHLRETK